MADPDGAYVRWKARKARGATRRRHANPVAVSRPAHHARKSPGPIVCRICETNPVPGAIAAVQVMQHPAQGHIWPQCAACRSTIAGHVAVFRAKIEARRGAPEEGWD